MADYCVQTIQIVPYTSVSETFIKAWVQELYDKTQIVATVVGGLSRKPSSALGPTNCNIRLMTASETTDHIDADEYSITIQRHTSKSSPDVVVRGQSGVALMFAMITFLQLLRRKNSVWTIPRITLYGVPPAE